MKVPRETHQWTVCDATLEYVEPKPWKYKTEKEYRVCICTAYPEHRIFVPLSKCCKPTDPPKEPDHGPSAEPCDCASAQDNTGGESKEQTVVHSKGCCGTREPLVELVVVKDPGGTNGRVCEVVVKKGYAWDGASGPTFDTRGSMQAALVHDVLYQCMRLDYITYGNDSPEELPLELRKKLREKVDALFLDMLKDGGMRWLRRWVWHRAVRWLGRKASMPKPHKDRRLAGAAIIAAGVALGALVAGCVRSRWGERIGAIAERMADELGWLGAVVGLLAAVVLAWAGIELLVGDRCPDGNVDSGAGAAKACCCGGKEDNQP